MIHLHFENYTAVKAGKAIFQSILKNAEKERELRKKLACGEGEGSITLTLTGDREIQKLNKEYRGKNTPTDVLSFGYSNQDQPKTACEKSVEKHVCPPELVGEIVISAEMAGRQAKEHGRTLEKELKNLFAHGLLHILGYDHETDAQEAEMERLASNILKGS